MARAVFAVAEKPGGRFMIGSRTCTPGKILLGVETGDDRNNYSHCRACQPNFTKRLVGFAGQPGTKSAFRGPTFNQESRKAGFLLHRNSPSREHLAP
jgi:hypothetical protein